MTLGRHWAGNAYGTNAGRLFVELEGEDAALLGTLRLNDADFGLVKYSIVGSFDEARLTLTGEPQTEVEGLAFGKLIVSATLSPKGNLEGEWETDIGSAGTFILFPHDRSQISGSDDQAPDRLYTARHQFGAIEIDREQIITLAEDIQRDFTKEQVVVTVVADSEQSRFLTDFKKLTFNTNRTEAIRIWVQESEDGGTNKVVSVEFGPQINGVMTQGADEAWVLGRLQKLKSNLRRFERAYSTNFKRVGFSVNRLLVVAAFVYLPSLPGLVDRAILAASIFGLIFVINWLHRRCLPFAAIYLGKKPEKLGARIAPAFFSWLITILATVAAIVLAGYLEGWLARLFTS